MQCFFVSLIIFHKSNINAPLGRICLFSVNLTKIFGFQEKLKLETKCPQKESSFDSKETFFSEEVPTEELGEYRYTPRSRRHDPQIPRLLFFIPTYFYSIFIERLFIFCKTSIFNSTFWEVQILTP